MGDHAAPTPSGVLLIGSIPLSSTEEVFQTLCEALPGKLQYIPDGETGVRYYYLLWQRECFPPEARRALPMIEGTEMPADHPGFSRDSIKPPGYDKAAIESYQKFKEMRDRGIIPQGVRFQVSIPLPTEATQFYLREEFHEELGSFYEQQIHDAVKNILHEIPAADLAIQWDMAVLCQAMEYAKGREGVLPASIYRTANGCSPKDPAMAAFTSLCEIVPSEVPVGIHLCYGNHENRHTIEPEDTAVMVDLANSAARVARRPLQWVHMPVPKERDDTQYFEALSTLDIGEDAKLYLGVVHKDDEEGTRKRIAAAHAAGVCEFGVATECGLGREKKENLESIFRISRDVTA